MPAAPASANPPTPETPSAAAAEPAAVYASHGGKGQYAPTFLIEDISQAGNFADAGTGIPLSVSPPSLPELLDQLSPAASTLTSGPSLTITPTPKCLADVVNDVVNTVYASVMLKVGARHPLMAGYHLDTPLKRQFSQNSWIGDLIIQGSQVLRDCLQQWEDPPQATAR